MGLKPEERTVLLNVLVYHYRRSDSGCGCGWGGTPDTLGRSWPEHVIQIYEESIAGLS